MSVCGGLLLRWQLSKEDRRKKCEKRHVPPTPTHTICILCVLISNVFYYCCVLRIYRAYGIPTLILRIGQIRSKHNISKKYTPNQTIPLFICARLRESIGLLSFLCVSWVGERHRRDDVSTLYYSVLEWNIYQFEYKIPTSIVVRTHTKHKRMTKTIEFSQILFVVQCLVGRFFSFLNSIDSTFHHT